MFRHLNLTGLGDVVALQCPTVLTSLDATPYRLPYTGLGALDITLCNLVAFFQNGLQPEPLPALGYTLVSLAELIYFPLVEASRTKPKSWLLNPIIAFTAFQLLTVGACIPWYWLLFLWEGGHRVRGVNATISQVDAEAITAGFAVGAVLPTLAMYYSQNSYATAVWQAFPLWVWLIQKAYTRVRGRVEGGSGYRTVQVVHALIFVSSTWVHWNMVFPGVGDWQSLKNMFTPSHVRLENGVLLATTEFLKLDIGVGVEATLVATFWLADNFYEILLLIAWHILAGIVGGPGAVLAGIGIWREWHVRR